MILSFEVVVKKTFKLSFIDHSTAILTEVWDRGSLSCPDRDGFYVYRAVAQLFMIA